MCPFLVFSHKRAQAVRAHPSGHIHYFTFRTRSRQAISLKPLSTCRFPRRLDAYTRDCLKVCYKDALVRPAWRSTVFQAPRTFTYALNMGCLPLIARSCSSSGPSAIRSAPLSTAAPRSSRGRARPPWQRCEGAYHTLYKHRAAHHCLCRHVRNCFAVTEGSAYSHGCTVLASQTAPLAHLNTPRNQQAKPTSASLHTQGRRLGTWRLGSCVVGVRRDAVLGVAMVFASLAAALLLATCPTAPYPHPT